MIPALLWRMAWLAIQKLPRRGEAYDRFFEALNYVCTYLAKKMAGDGEGATKLLKQRL